MSNSNAESSEDKEKYLINDFSECYTKTTGLSDKILDAFPPFSHNTTVRILVQGVIHLKDIFFPVADKIISEKHASQIELGVVLDRSEDYTITLINQQLSKLKEASDKDNYFIGKKIEPHGKSIEDYQIGNSILVHFIDKKLLDHHEMVHDYEGNNWRKEKYDAIFSCFYLHFALNWRVQLMNLLYQLKPNGLFAYTEVTGDFAFLDANFTNKEKAIQNRRDNSVQKDLMKAFINLIEQFDADRINRGFYWRPEIRMTDYDILNLHIKSLFSNISKLESTLVKQPTRLKNVQEVWMQKQLISYFSIGIEVEEERIQNFRTELTENFLGADLELDKGFNLILARRYLGKTENDNQKPVDPDWFFYSQLNKIQQINDHQYDTLGSKVLDVLASHDLFIPNLTYYCAIVGWNENKETRNYPIHLALNNNNPGLGNKFIREKINAFGRYISNKGLDFTIDEFIFRNIKQKFPISFRISDYKQQSLHEQHYTSYSIDISKLSGEEGSSLGFNFYFNDKGGIDKLDIVLPDFYNLMDDSQREKSGVSVDWNEKNWDFIDLNPAQEHKNIELDIFKLFDIKGKEFARLVINEKVVRQLSEKYNINIDFTTSRFTYEETYKTKGEKIFGHLGFSQNDDKRKKQVRQLIVTLYCIATFLLEGNKGEQVTIFPSGLIRAKESDQIKGLGGIILHEKRLPGDQTHPFIKTLVEKRNEGLDQVSNLLFSKANIASYVNIDYIDKSLKAAIAAIIARNGSHGLGSHVLPQVSHSAQNPFDNQQLFTYIEQRLDFIAQVATQFPSWTFPTWFNNDLMMRFYMQRQILRNLVKAEKLDAYEFDIEGEKQEKSWDQISLNIKPGERIILGGYVIRPEEERQSTLLSNTYTLSEVSSGSRSSENKKVLCHFSEKVHIDHNTSIQVIGACQKSDDKQFGLVLKNVRLIDQKLVIKVRKRTFIRIDENNQFIKDSHPTDSPGETAMYKHFPYSDYQYEKNLFDAGKIKSITKVLENATYKGKTIYAYGVLFEDYVSQEGNIEILKILSASTYHGNEKSPYILCNLKHPVREDTPLKSLLKLGRRVIIKGETRGKVNKDLRIENAQIVELIKINYIVGNQQRHEPQDRLEQDILVSIPGGVIGYQAFYTILENVIRNAAKHDWVAIPAAQKTGRNLEVKIELEERKNKDYSICRIWTNAMNLRDKVGDDEHSYIDILEGDEGERAGKKGPLIHLLNGFLKAPIINETGDWKRENLGLMETKIAAGYLSSQSIRNIGYPSANQPTLLGSFWNNDPGYVKASAVWERETEQLIPRLGFKFKLNKPKEVFILAPETQLEYYRERLEIEPGLLNKEGLSLMALKDYSPNQIVIDYEFFVTVLDSLSESTRYPDIINYVLRINNSLESSSLDHDKAEIARITNLLIEEIEYYPFRFFIIYNEAHPLALLKGDSKANNEVIRFIKSRIVFLKKDEFDPLFEKRESEEDSRDQLSILKVFKLKLYDQWLSQLRYKFREAKKGRETGSVYHSLFFDLGIEENEFQENLNRDKSAIAGTYETFKSFIITEFIKEINSGLPDTDQRKSLSDYLFQQKPEKEKYGGLNIFLQNWLPQPHDLEEILNLDEVRTQWLYSLQSVFEKYRDIYTKLYHKNGGQIETLPYVFRPIVSSFKKHYLHQNNWNDILLEDLRPFYKPYIQGSKEYVPAHNCAPIGYIRHSAIGKDPYFYLDYLSGGQIFYSVLKKYPIDRYAFNKLILQLVENPLAKIMVIDERVQDYVESFNYRNRLSNLNIIVPVALIVCDKERKKPEKYLLGNPPDDNDELSFIEVPVNNKIIRILFHNPRNTPVKKDKDQYKYLISSIVIHHSILETIFFEEKRLQAKPEKGVSSDQKVAQTPFQEAANEMIKLIKLKHIPSVIVTSGKGEPNDLSPYAKFLPFSNIESFLLQARPEKFLLTQILMKTLRRRS